MTEAYIPTEADCRRSMIHAAATLLKGTDAGTSAGVLAAAKEFNDWVVSSGESKPAATRTRKAAAEKTADTKTVSGTPADQPVKAAEPDILGDGENESFLSDDEAPAAPAKKAATIEDVRAALLKLQKETDAYTARTVLSKNANGADTLGKIKPENFQTVIDAAVKQGTAKIAQPSK